MYRSNEGYQDVDFMSPRELKMPETSKGKKKRWRNNSSRVEEDQFKVMQYNILVCGVFIRFVASVIDSVILSSGIKCKMLLCRIYIKNSQIVAAAENLLLG